MHRLQLTPLPVFFSVSFMESLAIAIKMDNILSTHSKHLLKGHCNCVFVEYLTSPSSNSWCDPTAEASSSSLLHLCLRTVVHDAQHDSGAKYRPATLTLPFSTFCPAERGSLFNLVLVTSTQVHASISNSLPNNQGLWWSLIPTA